MVDLSDYPKTIKIKDQKEVVVRILTPSDEAEVISFMKGLPPEERIYFRDDVTSPSVLREWCHNIDLDHVIPLIAIENNRLIANWTLHVRENGWTRHLAKIRGIIAPEHRRRGLSAHMVYELLSIAQNIDIERVIIELLSPQKRLLTQFSNIGFNVDAVLKDWIKDLDGGYQDMLVLSMKIEPAWKKMEEMILDYGTHGG